ncbi:hypothetical protein VNI00_015771 [Paramarasmius palmivorus]|uniref:Uncharacterized protein n=1 Tax=Paramarasmius palmivorus TaxID=297713 RepID=A0AAW0BIG1_9AGAR
MSTCINAIPSNPDIDGIGIRLATYLQLFISVITLAVSPAKGVDSWWAIIITSLGLQIATIGDYHELSLYHALVVTWLTFPVFIISFYYGFLAWGKREIVGEVLVGIGLHMTFFVGFCLWVWITAPTFGSNEECNDMIKFGMFALLRPTGWVRYFCLYIVGIWTFAVSIMWIGLVCLTVVNFIARHNISFRRWFEATPTPKWNHVPSLNASVAVLTGINVFSLILSIVMIELMVHANADIVEAGSDEWTFGQIIAMILVAGPLLNLWGIMKTEYALGLSHYESLKFRPAAAFVVRLRGYRGPWPDTVQVGSDSDMEHELTATR